MRHNWVVDRHWIINRLLNSYETQLLTITAIAVDIPVSRFGLTKDGNICGTTILETDAFVGYNRIYKYITNQQAPGNVDLIVTYEQVIEAMREIIKENTNATE